MATLTVTDETAISAEGGDVDGSASGCGPGFRPALLPGLVLFETVPAEMLAARYALGA